MNSIEFYDLVVSMRKAQKEFYATNGQDWNSVRKPILDKSIELEKKCDAEISIVNAILDKRNGK